MSDHTITIDRAEYERYQDAGMLLAALKLAGVEKWENFEIAVKLFAKAKDNISE